MVSQRGEDSWKEEGEMMIMPVKVPAYSECCFSD